MPAGTATIGRNCLEFGVRPLSRRARPIVSEEKETAAGGLLFSSITLHEVDQYSRESTSVRSELGTLLNRRRSAPGLTTARRTDPSRRR